MNEIDVLRTTAQMLSSRKRAAALSNYKVLCNNIAFVNSSFRLSMNELKALHERLGEELKRDELITDDAKDKATPEYYFRDLVPTIISNDISIVEKFLLYATADDRSDVALENLEASRKGFVEFNNLVTTARQFIDSLVEDAYQLVLLDAKEANFHVLTSLSSFFKYATDSLVHSLFNPELEDCLQEFEGLTFDQKVRGKESHITKCEKSSFRNKVSFLFTRLSVTIDFQDRLNNLFHFSSESTHIGYVSTFFSSSNMAEVIFGDDIGPYLPSTENFSELKYEILETALQLYKDIYLPAIATSAGKLLEASAAQPIEAALNKMTGDLTEALATRNNSYFFPIKYGLVGSAKKIQLPCKCGTTRSWEPPHDHAELFCEGCGSKFSLLELSGEGSYIFTGAGPVRIIGAEGPQLTEQERAELHKQFYESGEEDLSLWTKERLLSLPEEMRAVLMALAAFRKPCQLSTLDSLLPELPNETIDGILKQLQSDKLVVFDSVGYSIAPSIRQSVYELIEENK